MSRLIDRLVILAHRAGLALALVLLFPVVILEPIVLELWRAWSNLCVVRQVKRSVKTWSGYWSLVFPKV